MEVEGLTVSLDKQQNSSNLRWLITVFVHSNQLSSECSKTNLPSSYSNNSHTHIDQKIADLLCQCYWEIQSNSFWGQPRQILDRFVHNFRISFFETEAQENCFWPPQLCCQNQKLIGLIQEHDRGIKDCAIRGEEVLKGLTVSI